MSFHKGMRILRNYGMAAFLKRFFLFLFQNIFVFKTYYLCRRALNNFVKTELKLRALIPCWLLYTFRLKWISFFRMVLILAHIKIFKILKNYLLTVLYYFVFFRQKWAHTSWASINSGSNIDPFFEQLRHEDEVCIGTCSTNPEYRGLGLYPYALSKICEFFKQKEFLLRL